MSTTHESAETLRQRARRLRTLAARLAAARAGDLVRLAGGDTWAGPSAEACVTALRVARTQLGSAGESLNTHAARLERIAAELDLLPVPNGPR